MFILYFPYLNLIYILILLNNYFQNIIDFIFSQVAHSVSISLILILLLLLFISRFSASLCAVLPYFNTSLVTVYLYVSVCVKYPIRFKYISCYCLSNYICPESYRFLSFQYISCYCLSEERKNSVFKDYEFQYISCYCLSAVFFICWKYWRISIHLMLLFGPMSRFSTS